MINENIKNILSRTNKSFLLALTGLVLLISNLYSAPATPTITVPSGSGSSYTQLTWLKISASDSTYNINDCQIQITNTDGDWVGPELVYDNYASRDTTYVQFSSLGTATNITIIHKVQSSLTPDTYYMRVMVWNDADDLESNRRSSWSATRTFTINNVSTGWTDTGALLNVRIKRGHFNEIRTVVDNWRSFRGMSVRAWTYFDVAAGALINKDHMLELRTAADEVYTNINADIAAGASTPTYTDAVTGGTSIRAIHIEELRDIMDRDATD